MLTDQQVQVVGQPPWLAMPASGVPFNEVAYVALPAIGTEANVIRFVVPDGMNGAIVWIGNNFVGGGWVEGSGNVVWRIEADGVAIRNHENIVSSLGNPAAPSRTAPIRIHEGQVITLVIVNVNDPPLHPGIIVAGQQSGGRLSGWFYSLNEEAQGAWL
jgi:hypothetical protein